MYKLFLIEKNHVFLTYFSDLTLRNQGNQKKARKLENSETYVWISHPLNLPEEEAQIAYSVHRDHADLDCVVPHAAVEHLDRHQVMPALAEVQGMDREGLEGKGLFRKDQETYILKELLSIKISVNHYGKKIIWYP